MMTAKDAITILHCLRDELEPGSSCYDAVTASLDALAESDDRHKTKIKTNIKPCPFCGQQVEPVYDYSQEKWWISCNNPKCKIQPFTDMYKNKIVVFREWNKRVKE